MSTVSTSVAKTTTTAMGLIIGQRYGHLTVQRILAPYVGATVIRYLLGCSCGNVLAITWREMLRRKPTTCGCTPSRQPRLIVG